ncbi:MAG: gluconate 2-dehydrogenase subunit 3 family protein [Nitrospirae bacterium]|nr:MAG: gluconate 2-dehydrogenase subunit 3 family protein [Nitrospirota bacterium]
MSRAAKGGGGGGRTAPLPCRWSPPLSRRAFLAALAAGAATVAVPGCTPRGRRTPAAAAAAPGPQAADPWPTLAAVHRRLWPDDGHGPGAEEIRATPYLRQRLAEPDFDPEERRFLLQGAGWLEELARKEEGAPFPDLPPERADRLLRRIQRSEAGERWLSSLVTYVVEALLADPVYGGNPGGVGWSWLRHVPGFPRPTRANWIPALRRR